MSTKGFSRHYPKIMRLHRAGNTPDQIAMVFWSDLFQGKVPDDYRDVTVNEFVRRVRSFLNRKGLTPNEKHGNVIGNKQPDVPPWELKARDAAARHKHLAERAGSIIAQAKNRGADMDDSRQVLQYAAAMCSALVMASYAKAADEVISEGRLRDVVLDFELTFLKELSWLAPLWLSDETHVRIALLDDATKRKRGLVPPPKPHPDEGKTP